jgi:hypothetical protein
MLDQTNLDEVSTNFVPLPIEIYVYYNEECMDY